jgi:hypothetical protein
VEWINTGTPPTGASLKPGQLPSRLRVASKLRPRMAATLTRILSAVAGDAVTLAMGNAVFGRGSDGPALKAPGDWGKA